MPTTPDARREAVQLTMEQWILGLSLHHKYAREFLQRVAHGAEAIDDEEMKFREDHPGIVHSIVAEIETNGWEQKERDVTGWDLAWLELPDPVHQQEFHRPTPTTIDFDNTIEQPPGLEITILRSFDPLPQDSIKANAEKLGIIVKGDRDLEIAGGLSLMDDSIMNDSAENLSDTVMVEHRTPFFVDSAVLEECKTKLCQLLTMINFDYYKYMGVSTETIENDGHTIWDIWMINPGKCSSKSEILRKSHHIDLRLAGGLHPDSMTPDVQHFIKNIIDNKNYLVRVAKNRYELDRIAYQAEERLKGVSTMWQNIPEVMQLHFKHSEGDLTVIQGFATTESTYYCLGKTGSNTFAAAPSVAHDTIKEIHSIAKDKKELKELLQEMIKSAKSKEEDANTINISGHHFMFCSFNHFNKDCTYWLNKQLIELMKEKLHIKISFLVKADAFEAPWNIITRYWYHQLLGPALRHHKVAVQYQEPAALIQNQMGRSSMMWAAECREAQIGIDV